jgi:hypothetical protein
LVLPLLLMVALGGFTLGWMALRSADPGARRARRCGRGGAGRTAGAGAAEGPRRADALPARGRERLRDALAVCAGRPSRSGLLCRTTTTRWLIVAPIVAYLVWAYRRSEYGIHETGARKSKLLDFLSRLPFLILGLFLVLLAFYSIISAIVTRNQP